MRASLRLLVAAGVVPLLAIGVSAFDSSDGGARGVSVSVVGDAAAYLALEANSASPNDCFVSESPTTGKLTVSFAAASAACAADGGGIGINAPRGSGSGNFTRYAFHDLLLVTNKGTRDVLVWANATSTRGLVDVAQQTVSGAMTDADYVVSQPQPISLAVGATGYVGVRVNTTTLDSGNVAGTLDLVARASG